MSTKRYIIQEKQESGFVFWFDDPDFGEFRNCAKASIALTEHLQSPHGEVCKHRLVERVETVIRRPRK